MSFLASPISGSIVLALLVALLVRRGLAEADGEAAVGSRLLLVLLLVAFVADVVARFALLSS